MWVEGFSSSFGFGWVLACEQLGELVDIVRLNGGERDGCISLCHRVHLTLLHPNFRTPSRQHLTSLSSMGYSMSTTEAYLYN